MYVVICIWLYGYMCMCTFVFRPEVNIRYLLQPHSNFIFILSLLLNLVLTDLEEVSKCSDEKISTKIPLRELRPSLLSSTSGQLHVTVLITPRCQLSPKWQQGQAVLRICKRLFYSQCLASCPKNDKPNHLSFNNEEWWTTTVTITWGDICYSIQPSSTLLSTEPLQCSALD